MKVSGYSQTLMQVSQTTSSQPHTQQNAKSGGSKKDVTQLSAEEMQAVQKLQARDLEVRAHEAAHQAASGGLGGGASFTYEQGPDGRMYAVGGEVPISMPSSSTPQETITNARKVIAAALAPANPSSQDLAVASSAKLLEMKAQQKLLKEKMQEMQGIKEYSNNITFS